nr:hypothetical protein [Tanacetum cinerariifolium]
KKKPIVVTSDPLALIAEKTKVSKSKDKVLFLQTLKEVVQMNSEINANMVFMAQIEKVLSDSEASSSSDDEKISKVSYYLSESESESEYETSEYYD